MGSITWLYAYMPISDFSVFWPGLILIGFTVGMYGGGRGTGGTWMVTPGLNILGFPMPFAIGTAICHMAGMSVLFALRHPKTENTIDYKLGLVMLLGSLAGIEAGLHIMMHLERIGLAGSMVRWAYMAIMVFLLVCAIRNQAGVRSGFKIKRITRAHGAGSPNSSAYGTLILPVLHLKALCLRSSILGGVLVSLAMGIAAGFLGLGGGLLLLPVFPCSFEITTPVVMGADILEIVVSGVYGAFTYTYHGRVELVAVFVILLCSIIGENAGYLSSRFVKRSFGKFLSIAVIIFYLLSIILKQTQNHYYAMVVLVSGIGLVCLLIFLLISYGFIKQYYGKSVENE